VTDALPRVLAAPDTFKGTIAAADVAAAIARGGAGLATVDRCPVADGGEGTAAVLVAARGGSMRHAAAVDPLGRELRAAYGMLDDGRTAVVDVAAASGLDLVEPARRDAHAASTYGTGLLIADAIAHGARHVMVAAGGSATTDGGAGALDALRAAGGLQGAQITVLADVTTPFEAAAAVFAPQKGADRATVAALEQRLQRMAEAAPRDPRGRPGTGAAGGLAGGLWAHCGAQIVAGAPYVLDAVSFTARLAGCRAVLTGEGQLDAQSLHGKLTGEVLRRARAAGVPCCILVGRDTLHDDPLGADVRTAGTVAAIEEASRRWIGALVRRSP